MRIYSTITALLILTCLAVSPVRSEDTLADFEPALGNIAGNDVNIRAGKGLNFEVLCQMNKGMGIKVIGEEEGWYKVELPKHAGCYIHKDYVDQGIVQGEKLRVRSGPGLNYSVLGTLNKGDKIQMLGEKGDWIRISPPQQCSGWIAKDLVRLLEDQNNAKAAEKPKEAASKETETEEMIPEPAPQKATPPKEVKSEIEEKTIKEEITEQTRELIGIIEDSGRIFNRPSSYKIALDNDGGVYYLKGENINFKHYLYRRVKVVGTLEKVDRFPYPVMAVKNIEAIQQ